MKKVLALVLSLFLVLACASCYNVSYRSYENSESYLIGNQEYSGDLDKIEIHWVSGGINLEEDSNATSISVSEVTNLGDDYKVRSLYKDKVLHIEFWKSGFSSVLNHNDKYLTIKFKSVKNVDIELTSGYTNIDKLNVEEFNYHQTSGSLTVGELNANKVNVTQTSGKFYSNKINAAELNIHATSGDIDIKDLVCPKANIELTSGDVYLVVTDSDNIVLNATSGNIDITLPKDGATFKFTKVFNNLKAIREYNLVNGEYVFGTGKLVVNASITSGKLTVR